MTIYNQLGLINKLGVRNLARFLKNLAPSKDFYVLFNFYSNKKFLWKNSNMFHLKTFAINPRYTN